MLVMAIIMTTTLTIIMIMDIPIITIMTGITIIMIEMTGITPIGMITITKIKKKIKKVVNYRKESPNFQANERTFLEFVVRTGDKRIMFKSSHDDI